MRDFVKNALAEALRQQQYQWILWSPVMVAVGVWLYFSLLSEPPLSLGAVSIGAAAIVMRVLFHKGVIWRYAGIALVLVAIGFTAAQIRTHTLLSPVLQKEHGPAMVTGKVVALDQLPSGWRVTFEQPVIEDLSPDKTPHRVRVKIWDQDYIPKAGDKAEVLAVILPLSAPVLPEGYDFQRHAFFQGLGATGYAVGKIQQLESGVEKGYFFETLRHTIRERIETRLDGDTAAVLTALMVGESKGISDDTWQDIRDSGIAHLLAISGFHITLIFTFLFFSIRAVLAAFEKLALRYPVKKISAVLALGGTVFYVLLISSPIPAQRTAMMMGVVTLAILLDREAISLRLVAFAALLILLLRPESLLGPSFQMSFAAVAGLVAFYEGCYNTRQSLHRNPYFMKKFALYVLGCVLTTIIATLATAPYTIYHFQRLPLFSGLVANVIAVPLSGFWVLPVGLLACVLVPLGLDGWLFHVAGYGVNLILETAQETASWPYAVVQANAWPPVAIFFFTLAGLVLVIQKGWLRLVGVLPFLIGVFSVAAEPRPDVMVSDDGDLMAVRGADGGILLSPGRGNRFEREQWSDREGSHGTRDFTEATRADGLLCDDYGCLYRQKETVVALVTDPLALAQDCPVADILISAEPVPDWQCRQPQRIIDMWDLRDNGAMALYLDSQGSFHIKSVQANRGQRPWMPAR